jgi:phosphatidylglycerol:prolipoprotein diacylglycerol transferase
MTPRQAYTLFMLLSVLVFVVARRLQGTPAAVAALPWRYRVALALAAFVGGSLASKLPFLAAGSWLADGKTILAGLAGGYLTVELVKRRLRIRVKTGDTFALPLALAIAVGRLGCFFNGCCYGIETNLPWGVDFGDHLRRHPTQIYESLFHLAMAGVILVLAARGELRFQRLKLYLIAYCAYRFLTEFIRPEPPLWLGLTFYQWLSLAMAAALAFHWRLDARALMPPSTTRGAADAAPSQLRTEGAGP